MGGLLRSLRRYDAAFRAAEFGFSNYDDPRYVTSNSAVQGGLTWAGGVWAFTAASAIESKFPGLRERLERHGENERHKGRPIVASKFKILPSPGPELTAQRYQ
jgi:hypothetical protein